MKALIGNQCLTFCVTHLPVVPESSSTCEGICDFFQSTSCHATRVWHPLVRINSFLRVWTEEKHKLVLVMLHYQNLYNPETLKIYNFVTTLFAPILLEYGEIALILSVTTTQLN